MKNKKYERVFFNLIGIALIVLFWQFLTYLMGKYIVPPPINTLKNSVILVSGRYTREQILLTLTRIIAGFFLALFAGTIIGVLIGKYRRLDYIFKPAVFLLQGIPPILWAIPLVLVLGVSGLSPVIVIGLICLPLIIINISEGVRSIPEELEKMIQVFSPGVFSNLKYVTLHHLSPFFKSSVELGVALGIKASVVAEYFGANNGIGFQIQAAFQSLEVLNLFSWGLILITLIIISAVSIRFLSFKGITRKIYSIQMKKLYPVNIKKYLSMGKNRGYGLKISGVSFSYGNVPVLDNINLNVNPGEIAVISGDSGIGKTTLLKIISSLLKPEKGTVIVPGRVGFVFQDDRLLPWYNVVQNVAIPLLGRGIPRVKAYSITMEIIKLVGLEKHFDKFPEQLSGGMKKRVCMARCMISLPDVVLMDEPFSGLDKRAKEQLWSIICSIIEDIKVPVVISTHHPEEIGSYPGITRYILSGKPANLKMLNKNLTN